MIDVEVLEVIELAIMYMEQGLPPCSGGVYDQTANFINAARFVRDERLHWKAKHKWQSMM